MSGDTIFAKTPKGVEEIRNRANGLPQRIRSLLILVDGKASVDALRTKLGMYAEFDDAIELLRREGYIAPDGARAEFTDAELRAALDSLSGILDQALGPRATPMRGMLDSASSRTAFEYAIRRATTMLMGGAGGARVAAQFQARAQAILDVYFRPRGSE